MSAMCCMAVGYVIYEARTGNAKNEYSYDSLLNTNADAAKGAKASMHSNILIIFGNDEADDSDAADSISLMGTSGAYSYSRIGKAYE